MSSHNHLTYAKASKTDIDALMQTQRDELFEDVVESYDTLRLSLDNLWCILKWVTDNGSPRHIGSVSNTTYTHNEMLTLLNVTENVNWNESE